MSPRKPTIDDVARLSGVGRTTVSRVLNGGPNVRDEVRRRVLDAVEALNYRVNPQARSLAGGGSRMLALVLASNLEAEPNSYYGAALELGALRQCLALGYQLIAHHVVQDSADRERQVLELVTTQNCEGVILTPPFVDDVGLIEALRGQGCHVAAVSPGHETQLACDAVGIDDEAGGHDIGAHLLAMGHRRFGFISGIAGHLAAERRLDGLMRALADRGLGADAVTVLRGDFTFRSGSLLTAQLLDGGDPPTALICANDDMAAGALSVAHGRGVDVPGRLSITGFDDTPMSGVVWPPLTTVHQPLKAMGAGAVKALADRLRGAGADFAFTRLPHEVVVRGSAARPMRALSAATA